MFSVRIVTADYYVSNPVAGLDAKLSSSVQVPVIRIFGSTPAGQKTCLHVHGVFPYLYVPYDGTQPCSTYLHQFAASLDKAINIATGHSTSNTKHVYKISLVSGIPMYGYHEKEEQFLKIYFYNPNLIKKVADLLLGGAVLNKVFQPHEAHIPYLLQMFIDYNLYGMNLLNVNHVKFRRRQTKDKSNVELINKHNKTPSADQKSPDVPNSQSWLNNDINHFRWNDSTVSSEMLLDEDLERMSTCELEVDIVAADILNRLDVNDNIGVNPGLTALWNDEKERRRLKGLSSQCGLSQSQERENLISSPCEEALKNRLQKIIQFHQMYGQHTTHSQDGAKSSLDSVYPASLVESHSFTDDTDDSQKTVVYDEEEMNDEVAAVVYVECVNQVLESSQSFQEDHSSQLAGTDLTKLLASMLASQGEKLSQDRTVNDSDSILSSQPLEDPEEDERESVTMSQVFKDEDFPLESDAERHNYIKSDDFSQSLDEEMVSDDILDVESDEETIPQFDGPIDEKPADEQPKIRKRMGPRGPVISSANNPSPVSSEGQASSFSNYGPIFQNDPGFLGSGSNMQAYQSPTNYQDYDRRWDTHAFREDMSSGVPSVDQQSSHWNPAWSRSLHSARADPSSYAGAGNVHGNNGSYMTEGFSRPYANQQPQNHPSQAATLSESSTDQYPASFPYDMTNIYSPDSYSRSRTSDSGHTSDPHNSPFAGHLSPSPGYSRDGFESSRSPVPLSGNVGIQGSGSSMYNQTPSLPPPEESQGSFHKLLTCNDSPKQSIPADLSTHQSLQRSISRCSTHSSESISMGASTTPDPFKSLPKPVSSEDTTMETFEKMSSIEKLDETTEGRSSVDSSNHPPSETGNASLTPLDGSNSQKKHMSSINISHEDLFGTPSLNSCADLSSDSFTSAEGSRHQSVVDQSNQGSFISSGYSNKNTSHPQRCSSVTSEEEAPSYQSLTMSFPGNQSGNRSHSAIASLEQMVSSVGGYDIGYDYAAFPNRAWQCAGTQPSHNVTPLHNISAGPTMPPGGNLPANTSMPSGTSMSTGSNMPSAPSISSGPNMPPNQTLTSGQNMTRSNMPPVSNMTLGSGMPSGSNLHSAPNMTPGHNIQNRNLSSSGHNMPAISPGPSLTPTNMPPHSIPTNHNMPSRPNVAPVNMSQSQHVTQVRALTPNMSTSLHGGHTMGRSVTPHGHGHAMHPQVHNISQGHSVHPSHNLAAAPQLPPPGHSPATSPPSAHGHNMSGHSISSGHNMMQTHNLPQGHHVTQGHERSHSYNISEPNYTTQDVMMPKQGRMALKKKRGEADNWSYGKSYYQQGRSWNQHPGPPGQNYRNTTYWRYMDTYQTYQGYVQNPKVEPGTISQTPKLQPVLPPGAPPEKSKRGRKRSSFTMAKSMSAMPVDSQLSQYTYTFHVPTPIYKRLKLLQKSMIPEENAVCIVRMHPMDARRYSLLKIGRELVKIPKLEERDIKRIQKEIKETGYYPGACSRFGYMVPSDQPSISTKIGLLPGLLNEPKPVSSYEPGIKYVTVDRKLLPMSAKGMGKNAPSGFQLEYERMLSQNPRNRARSNVKIKLTKAKEKRRRRKVRVTNRRKGSCDLLSDSSLYTDCSLVSQLPYNKNLPSTTPHNQYLLPSSASEITSHSKTPVLIETLHSPPIANIQSSNATENTLPPVKTTHVRRSTRPFPKHNVVPPLPGARPRIITDNKYRSSNNNNFNTQNSQLPTSHATNITPPVKLCPGQCPEQPTNLTMSLPQQTADTTFDAHPKIDNITELEVRPSSSNNSSPSPLSSCKDNQSPFPTNIGSPHDPPPTSGSSLWQPSNTPTGQSFTVNSSIQSSSNSQDSQQVRKRKLGSDNGSQDGSKRTMNFSTMDFTDIYDPHSEGYDDDDVDADDDDDGDDDDDDDDSHDNFDHKASSGNVCCLVVNKRAHQRSLVVKLEKLKLPSKTVKASEFLATRDGIPHRSCVGNKIPGRVENIGWERIKLADKNKYRGGVPLMSYSSPISDDNGRLSLFTQHSGSMFYDRPASDYFQDEYLGVAIAGSLDESNDTGLLMSIDDDGYSQMINTDSSSGEDATISYEEEFEIKSRGKNKRKRNLTPNQRLGVAFLTTRHRRKRAVAMNHGKLMNSLSLLHQATLAKLSTLSTYTDSSDDFKKTYNDVMSKLALFSPPVSEKGDTSPPQPLSPEENAPLPVVDGNPDDVSLDSTDGVLSRPNFLSQTSLDSIYETPLSSVETQRSCESAKSPSLTSLGGSETEPTSDIIVPVVKQDEAAENKSPPIPTLLSWKNETPTEKSPYAVKTAVVKLIPRARSGSKSKVDCKPENNNNDLEVAVPLNSTIRNFSIINSNQQKESSEIEGFPNVQFRIECKQKASVDQLETSQAHSKLVVSNQSSNCTEDEISRAEEQTNTSPGPYQTGIYSLNCPEETSSDRLNSYSNCDAADTDVGYLMDKIDNEETQNTLIEERETVSEVCHKDTTEKSEVELKNIANKLPASPGIELGGNLEETEKSTEHQVLQTTQLICELNKETEETTAKQTGVTCDSEMVESAQRKETVKKISETADQENGVSKAASESIKNTTESHLHIGSQNTICEEGPLNDVSSQKEVNGGQCITTSKQGEISRSGEEVEQGKKALAAEDDVFNSDITTLDLSVSPKTGVLQSSKSSGNSSKEKESADTSEPNQTNQAAPKKSQKVNVGSNESIGSERQDDHFKNASPQPVAGKESLVLTPRDRPPSKDLICHTATKYGLSIPKVTEPFCGKPEDITETPREHGGRILRLQCNLIKDLTPFASTLDSDTLDTWRFVLAANNKTIPVDTNLKSLNEIVNDPQVSCHLPGSGQRVWVPCLPPPSYQRVKSSLAPPSPSPTPPPLSSLSSQQPQSSSSSQPAPPPSSLSSPSSSSSQPPPSPSSSPSSSYSSSSSQNNKRATQQLKVNLKIDPKNIGSTGESDKECFKKLTGHSPKHLSTSPLTISPIFSNLNNKKKNETSFDDSLFGSENFMCDKPAQEIDPGVTSSAQHQDLLKQDILSDSEILDLEETLVEPKSPVWADRSDRSVKNLSQDTNLAQSNSQDDRSKSVSERENMQTLNVALPENLPSTRIVPQFHSTPVHRISVSSPLASPTPVSKPQLTESANKSNDTLPSKATKGHTLSSSHKLKRKAISNQMKQWSLNSTLTSQIDIATPKNSCGFKVSQIQCKDTKSSHKVQHICLMSLELLMRTRGDRCPDPQTDDIQAAFCVFLQDSKPGDMVTVVIVVDDDHLSLRAPKGSNRSRTLHATALPEGVDIIHVTDETELMHKIESLVQSWDPDMLIGYEVTTLSWGYLLQRAAYLNIELASKISRIPNTKAVQFREDFDIQLPGRIVLNLWKILRHEVTLNIYTFENVYFHVLHQRIPHYSNKSLTTWFNHQTDLHRWRVLNYYIIRSKGNTSLIESLDLISKTSEMARVFGIEFYHVLSRGSQYRVESMMLRIAKPLNFVAVSPSVHQRSKMQAPECIPLTLEPLSNVYTDPVVVLDFQSLYPSIMIAYNYCFSTCLGRLDHLATAHEGPIKFGCTQLKIPPDLIKKLEKDVTISPNGIVFVKEHIRKGIISRMVEEILNTRLMVKKSMKNCDDKNLLKLLHARQLGLKLIANVTYGYTGANFSGRMPCIEVGDSIVRKARETLEKAIKLIEDTPSWGAKVIYGDTDSIFIQLKGYSKEGAIILGQHIAQVVTENNPKPVKLKFEKVYLPCVLQTKKRYSGFMYESVNQKEPVFDAKGIETVRRDGCSAASKILERSLKILFTTRDVSRVKNYVQTQCRKMLEGKVNLQDFVFAKEYRGMNTYRPGACVPALEIAKKLIQHDHRAEPQSGERVPYIIVCGEPGLPLIQLVRQPLEVLGDSSLRLNTNYYITKAILPPLQRIFSLLGINVFKWYSDLPRVVRYTHHSVPEEKKKGTISQYFNSTNCPVCHSHTKQHLCPQCAADPQLVAVSLNSQLHKLQQTHHRLSQICQSCQGLSDSKFSCISLDCPIMYRVRSAQNDLHKLDNIQEILNNL